MSSVADVVAKVSLCGPPLFHDQTLISTVVVHCPRCNWWVAPDDPAYKLVCEELPTKILQKPRRDQEIPRLGE